MNINFKPDFCISWTPALSCDMSIQTVRHQKPPVADGQTKNGLNIEEVCKKYASLVKYLAGRLAAKLPPHISLDDLNSTGVVGLIDAANKFDNGKKIRFKTYAEFRIRGAMLDELRSLDWVPRTVRRQIAEMEKAVETLTKELGRPPYKEEVAQRIGITLDKFYSRENLEYVAFSQSLANKSKESDGDALLSFLEDGKSVNPINAIASEDIRSIIAAAIGQLPHKEKTVISLYYYEELTMREIGEIMGYTESNISILHSKAIARLKIFLNGELKNLSE